jgi:hypothetical protein
MLDQSAKVESKAHDSNGVSNWYAVLSASKPAGVDEVLN